MHLSFFVNIRVQVCHDAVGDSESFGTISHLPALAGDDINHSMRCIEDSIHRLRNRFTNQWHHLLTLESRRHRSHCHAEDVEVMLSTVMRTFKWKKGCCNVQVAKCSSNIRLHLRINTIDTTLVVLFSIEVYRWLTRTCNCRGFTSNVHCVHHAIGITTQMRTKTLSAWTVWDLIQCWGGCVKCSCLSWKNNSSCITTRLLVSRCVSSHIANKYRRCTHVTCGIYAGGATEATGRSLKVHLWTLVSAVIGIDKVSLSMKWRCV